jgi:hypothetical protein
MPLNPSDCSTGIIFSEDYRTIYTTSLSTLKGVRGTKSRSSGKWYFEAKFTNRNTISQSNYLGVGVASKVHSLNIPVGGGANRQGWGHRTNGYRFHRCMPVSNTSQTADPVRDPTTSSLATITVLDTVVGVAVDLDQGGIWFSKNNAWLGYRYYALSLEDPSYVDAYPDSLVHATNYYFGDPSANTYPAYADLIPDYINPFELYPMVSLFNSNTGSPYQMITVNLMESDLIYSPPTGFLAWEAIDQKWQNYQRTAEINR